MYISITVVTIIITTPLTVETLFSVTTVSRQIEKRLFLKTTFGTSSKRLRSRRCRSICVNNRIYIYIYIEEMRIYRVYISFIAFVAHRFIASIFWRVYLVARQYIDVTRPNI